MGQLNFRIFRQTDSQVFAALQNIVETFLQGRDISVSATNVHIRPDGSQFDINWKAPEANDAIRCIFALHTDAILSLTLSLGQLSLQLHRPEGQELDNCSINYPDNPRGDTAIRVLALELYALAKKHLKGFDPSQSISQIFGAELAKFYEQRELALFRLEQVNLRMTEEIESYRRSKEQEFDQRKLKLDEQITQDRESLKKQHEDNLAEIARQKSELDEKLKQVDDRESRHVRRQIRTELKKQFEDYSKKFETTEGTRNLRNSIFWTCIIVMVGLGIATGVYFVQGITLLSTPNPSSYVPLIVFSLKQVFLTAAFIGVFTFFLKWNNQWFQQHAREEFRLKRLAIDFDRASWVVEMASEWKMEKGTDLPTDLLDRLTKNLFAEEKEAAPEVSPADHLASAILGATASATLDTPAGKLSIDRKGINQLKKDA